MSVLKHATVSAWQRDEQGGYRSEKNGWELRVTWKPASRSHRRGFLWQAARAGGPTLRAPEVHEEIEIAMAEAEEVALPESTPANPTID